MRIFWSKDIKLFLLTSTIVLGLTTFVEAQVRTPGVYVEEISTFPASIAQVETAVPAFIGCTQSGPAMRPIRIANIADFIKVFGGPEKATISVNVGQKIASNVKLNNNGILYYSLEQYFKNGGGPCYIVSIGNFGSANYAKFTSALGVLKKADEPTLILLPEAAYMGKNAYGQVIQAVLNDCKLRKDRFGIFDYYYFQSNSGQEDITDYKKIRPVSFRESVGSNNLSYGAVYTPFLQTLLPYAYDEDQVSINMIKASKNDKVSSLADIKKINKTLYNQIKAQLAKQFIVLPPSSTVAGIYCTVDKDRGVWKAPANVGLSSVTAPVKQISNAQQEGLNMDPTTGKSINVIRSYSGRGPLIWGARTLAGNDNEWRYVPTRRLFISIEESVQKGTTFAVFEPNDKNTWLNVKSVVESYLYGLWQQGALVGSTPEKAFFVKVGLGETMTANDISNGRLIIQMGIATVRPAEFIISQVSHKMQKP
ncbi:MAG: phage tail sheath C-terminal domain-containing protein [Bacteroidota bacterium]